MLAMRQYSLAGSLVLLSLLACDRNQPVEPSIDAASTTAPGLTVNAPSNAQLVAVSASRIYVSWQDNSTKETGFEVWRSPSGLDGTFTKVAETGAEVTTYSDTGVDPSTAYCYKVRAFKRPGGRTSQTSYSEFSASACAPAGDVQVTVVTTGVDLDPDGYTARLDALSQTGVVLVASPAIATNATVTIPRLRIGDYYRVTLGGLAANCAVSSANPQAVTVGGGGTAAVGFDVGCTAATGSLQATTATTGTDPDPDGYSVSVDGGPSQPIATNGSLTISGLQPGGHVVGLGEVAANCEVTGANPITVGVTAGATAEVAFAIACAPVTQLAFMNAWDASGAWVDAEIYVINSNGTGATRLTAQPGSDEEPAWSPDGHKIAFWSDRDGNAEIYVMNADGSNPVRLTNQPGWDANPAWSPDGGKIAFSSGNGAIYVMDADGSELTELTSAGSQPAWSPDGAKLAFQRGVCFGGLCSADIFVMNADGSGATPLTSSEFEDETDPVWSPDGRKIAFVQNFSGIVIVNADGTNAVHLATGFDPAWRR